MTKGDLLTRTYKAETKRKKEKERRKIEKKIDRYSWLQPAIARYKHAWEA